MCFSGRFFLFISLFSLDRPGLLSLGPPASQVIHSFAAGAVLRPLPRPMFSSIWGPHPPDASSPVATTKSISRPCQTVPCRARPLPIGSGAPAFGCSSLREKGALCLRGDEPCSGQGGPPPTPQWHRVRAKRASVGSASPACWAREPLLCSHLSPPLAPIFSKPAPKVTLRRKPNSPSG